MTARIIALFLQKLTIFIWAMLILWSAFVGGKAAPNSSLWVCMALASGFLSLVYFVSYISQKESYRIL